MLLCRSKEKGYSLVIEPLFYTQKVSGGKTQDRNLDCRWCDSVYFKFKLGRMEKRMNGGTTENASFPITETILAK